MTLATSDLTTDLQTAALAVLRANAAKAAADAADKAAKAAFKAIAERAGADTVTVTDGDHAGAKVSLVEQPRLAYDADTLKNLVATGEVTKGAYYLVTERVIDPKEFRAALALGRLTEGAADKVTTVTYTTRVVATVPKQ